MKRLRLRLGILSFMSILFLSSCSDCLPDDSKSLSMSAKEVKSTTSIQVEVPQVKVVTLDCNPIEVIFSDIDGTLVHYPKSNDALREGEARSLIDLPLSSTGTAGVISTRTLGLCQEIRRQGVMFVLVSGMRADTLFKRLPFLPKADAYCCEAGGRIFYPVNDNRLGNFRVNPIQVNGENAEDPEPFFIYEDTDWRERMEMEDAAGKDGFLGKEIDQSTRNLQPISLSERKGPLWKHAQTLTSLGLVVDMKGYSTCFRVNENHQVAESDTFNRLLKGLIDCPAGLSTSRNLGCVDFYPSVSGKKNW